MSISLHFVSVLITLPSQQDLLPLPCLIYKEISYIRSVDCFIFLADKSCHNDGEEKLNTQTYFNIMRSSHLALSSSPPVFVHQFRKLFFFFSMTKAITTRSNIDCSVFLSTLQTEYLLVHQFRERLPLSARQ